MIHKHTPQNIYPDYLFNYVKPWTRQEGYLLSLWYVHPLLCCKTKHRSKIAFWYVYMGMPWFFLLQLSQWRNTHCHSQYGARPQRYKRKKQKPIMVLPWKAFSGDTSTRKSCRRCLLCITLPGVWWIKTETWRTRLKDARWNEQASYSPQIQAEDVGDWAGTWMTCTRPWGSLQHQSTVVHDKQFKN